MTEVKNEQNLEEELQKLICEELTNNKPTSSECIYTNHSESKAFGFRYKKLLSFSIKKSKRKSRGWVIVLKFELVGYPHKIKKLRVICNKTQEEARLWLTETFGTIFGSGNKQNETKEEEKNNDRT